MYTTLDRKCILHFPHGWIPRPWDVKEVGMRVWAFTMAMFLGLVMWRAELLDRNATTGGSPDNGTVTAMEDPFGPPKP
jgi:hypothetical protein